MNPTVLALAGLGAGGLVGIATAVRPAAALAVVAAIIFVPLVLIDLPLGIIAFAPVPFTRGFDWVWIGPSVAALLIFSAWLVTLRRDSPVVAALARMRVVLGLMVLMVVWLAMTALWASEPAAVAQMMLPWVMALLAATIVASTLRTGRHVELMLAAWVGGAVASVLLGFSSTGMTPEESVYASEMLEGRLAGGSGDPNYLAAGLVPAIVLCIGLAAQTRSAIYRWLAIMALGILAIGLGATQSRGGFVGAGVAVIVALLVMRRHRGQVLAGAGILLAVSAFYLAATPGALERVTNTDGGGTGRSDLWTVATRIVEENPVVGIGLNNFSIEAARYVRRPGQLTYVRMIVDEPHVVHNSYLELLTETGIIGLALYLGIVGGLIATTWRACRRLEADGRRLASLARAVFIAQVAALVPLIFVSFGYDMRLWLLLGIGPVLLAIARRPA